MVSTRSLDLRSVTSMLVDENSLDLCAHCRDRQYCKGQASQAGPFLCLADPPTEEVCWFLLEGLLRDVAGTHIRNAYSARSNFGHRRRALRPRWRARRRRA